MPELIYLKGDATEPICSNAMIAHIVNSIGGWGRGFVLALSKKWKEPERAYRQWYKDGYTFDKRPFKIDFQLGQVQFVPLKHPKMIVVANMIAQEGIYPKNGIPPIRYEALESCLKKVYDYCEKCSMTLHGPAFGSGLAGGDWNVIHEMICDLIKVDTYIYQWDGK